MINKDKFGRTIYDSRFMILLNHGNILMNQGYNESQKPNLFYRKIPEGCFFADMRGTQEVPIWSDTSPLFYWMFEKNIPMWRRRRLIEQEYNKLRSLNCPLRTSFEVGDSPECLVEFSNGSSFISFDEGNFYWENGFCKFCNKDMQQEGFFCSKECEEKHNDLSRIPCDICGKKFDEYRLLDHHTNYNKDEEKTISICFSCHSKIHLQEDKHPELKQYQPIGTRKEYLEIKNQEKLKKAEEMAIKSEERRKKEVERAKKPSKRPKFIPYSSNINNLNKNWYKRK